MTEAQEQRSSRKTLFLSVIGQDALLKLGYPVQSNIQLSILEADKQTDKLILGKFRLFEARAELSISCKSFLSLLEEGFLYLLDGGLPLPAGWRVSSTCWMEGFLYLLERLE